MSLTRKSQSTQILILRTKVTSNSDHYLDMRLDNDENIELEIKRKKNLTDIFKPGATIREYLSLTYSFHLIIFIFFTNNNMNKK